jgi:hypothetical protein
MFSRKPKAVVERSHAEQPLPPLQFSHPLPYGALLRDRSGRHEQGVQFALAGCGALASTVQIRNAALSDWFPL